MWRLEIAYPSYSLAAVLVLFVVLAGGWLVAPAPANPGRATSECPLEQMWYAGSVHSNERLELRADSSGTWIASGYDDHAQHERKELGWARNASSLTVMYDRSKLRTVTFKLEQRGGACYLTFEDHPVSERSPFRRFADWANF